MNVSLTPELEKFVHKQVGNGHYQTASEVVRAGLRRLKEDQDARLPQMPKTLVELEALMLKAAASLDAGRGVDGKEVFARLRQRSKSRRENG
jgi:antitoxin ParD1/3/4